MIEITLAKRDFYLVQIERQISAKRKMLLEKQNMLKKESKQNEFLRVVKDDYQKYYNHIIEQKQEQIRGMDIIKQYIHDIMVSGELTEEDILKTKREQKKVLHEISHIKGNLDNLIKQTDETLSIDK